MDKEKPILPNDKPKQPFERKHPTAPLKPMPMKPDNPQKDK